jgi:hypothetical protein
MSALQAKIAADEGLLLVISSCPVLSHVWLAAESDRVPESTLASLASSDDVRGALANPHLRALLLEIDRAPDAELALRKAMAIPIFTEFANACLAVCGVAVLSDRHMEAQWCVAVFGLVFVTRVPNAKNVHFAQIFEVASFSW